MLENNNEQKEEKDANSNINNNSSIPINTITEVGRMSGYSHEDHDYSDEIVSSKGGKNSFINDKNQPPIFLFKVKKLGQKGITHKTRLLYITPEKISYYQMVEKKDKNQNFLNLLNSIYRVIKNNDYDKQIYKKMLEAFKALPPSEKILKQSFQNYEIEELKESGSFKKAPIKVINLDVKNEQEKLNPKNYGIMETGYDFFRRRITDYKKYISNYLEDSEMSLEKDVVEISTKINTNNNMSKKAEENLEYEKGTKILIENKDMKDDIQTKKIKNRHVLLEEKDKIHYIGIFFQGFLKEYFEYINKSKKNKMKHVEYDKKKNNIDEKLRIEMEKKIKNENIKKQLYLELAIYYCYSMFVKHCEKVEMKIISDNGSFKTNRDILKLGKLNQIIYKNII